MNTPLSTDFTRLYCDETLFDSFSAFHPISFKRILPFQSADRVVDDSRLLRAEAAHLAARNDSTRLTVVDEYARCNLLPRMEATDLRAVIDFFDADFFELMGLAYANAGMFKCALRWYGELIRVLESQNPALSLDEESVYASAGYCLYSLGLFEEAIAWSKACIGPRPIADAIRRALISYEVEPGGGSLGAIERSGPRTRYTIVASEPDPRQRASELQAAMKALVPFEDVYLDWRQPGAPGPVFHAENHPFENERDAGSLLRHKMNLLCATCSRADALVAKGYAREAKRLLSEAALLAPQATMVWERLQALP